MYCQGKPCLLLHFPKNTFLGTFRSLKMPAESDPFVLIDILFLLYPVEHQIPAVLLDIA